MLQEWTSSFHRGGVEHNKRKTGHGYTTIIIIIRAHEANKDAPVNVHNFQINMILMDGAVWMLLLSLPGRDTSVLVPRALNDN